MEAEVLDDVFHIPQYVMGYTFPISNENPPCQYCSRTGEWDIRTLINGEEKVYWICGECPKSRMIMKKWRIIK